MKTVVVALAAGLAVIVLGLAVVLTRSPPVVAWSDSTPVSQLIAETEGEVGACQAGEMLPRDTSAVRVSLDSLYGPRLTIKVLSDNRVITRGAREAGWIGRDPTVAVQSLARNVSNVKVCFALGQPVGLVGMDGSNAGAAVTATSENGQPLNGRVKFEYLKEGNRTWWSMVPSVSRRLGFGRWTDIGWVTFLLIAAMAAVLCGTCWLMVKELRPTERRQTPADTSSDGTPSIAWSARRALARIPTAAWVCALIACLNAVCWSLITPPFQVPDETDHFAYVQQLAETRSLPRSGTDEYSPEEHATLGVLHEREVRTNPTIHTIASRAEQRTLENTLSQPLERSGPGGAGSAASEPPLYYALEVVPYAVGSGGNILERLQLMRLLSALMAAFTALFVFLFLREALPGVRWAWTVGGLGVALAPLLGFISGGVNPDAMLFAVSAALFYFLARGFRRGLTRPLAIAIGMVMAIGFMTKLNFIGLVAGAALGLILLARRQARRSGTVAYLGLLAPSLAIALSPAIVYGVVNLASGHPVLGVVSNDLDTLTSGHASTASGEASISHELEYIWQVYLPRLPWMHAYFGEIFTTRQVWFNGLVGLYGWLDTVFPAWVYDFALVPAAAIAILCLRELARHRAVLRRRIAELVTYVSMSVGVLILVALSGYQISKPYPAGFSEPRYLLPMLALWGAVLVLAARGAGRRWGPVVGAAIVLLIFAHDIFSQLQVVARYYG